MTATPKRDDGLDRILFLECGPLRHEVAVDDQIEEQGMRRLLVPRFSAARPDLEGRQTWHQVVDYISASEERNHLVATDAARVMRLGRIPLVLTRRVEHARALAGIIATLVDTLDVVVMDGSLVWCGDTAPLAYPRRDDCVLRFVSREVAAELMEALQAPGLRPAPAVARR